MPAVRGDGMRGLAVFISDIRWVTLRYKCVNFVPTPCILSDQDVNDNPPIFDQQVYNITFNEDLSDLGTENQVKLPLNFETTDGDRSLQFGNQSLVFEILSSRYNLEVDNKTGDIFADLASNNFDFEIEPEPEITVSL